jgi:hypothetical protein
LHAGEIRSRSGSTRSQNYVPKSGNLYEAVWARGTNFAQDGYRPALVFHYRNEDLADARIQELIPLRQVLTETGR